VDKNKVIAGNHEGYNVKSDCGLLTLNLALLSGQSGTIEINRNTVRKHEVVTSNHRKSAVSGIMRGLIGEYIFDSVGLIGGTTSAKNRGDYIVAVEFRDGRRSLIEIDEKK